MTDDELLDLAQHYGIKKTMYPGLFDAEGHEIIAFGRAVMDAMKEKTPYCWYNPSTKRVTWDEDSITPAWVPLSRF